MLRNFAYGGLALIGGAITGIVVSSWATPTNPPQLAPEVARVIPAIAPAATLTSSSSPAPTSSDCSPWEVSEVAMEAALKEMVRRGWRPPSQGEVLASFGVESPNPDLPVPVPRPPTPVEEEPDPTEAFAVDQPGPAGAAATAAPSVIEVAPPSTVEVAPFTPPSN